MKRSVRSFLKASDGAVAPTVALSLFALIGMGGIAFDYARLVSLDTELQNAADQAALAAASQLDGKSDACSRAVQAAESLVANKTLMANEAAGTRAIVVADEAGCDAAGQVRFYQDKAKSNPATDATNAKFVEVQVTPRQAFYALTPVVGAFSSGDVNGIAFAGLGEAICRVPPLMLCNPAEDDSPLTDDELNVNALAGRGLRLVANDGGGMAPGNFGFLDNEADGQNLLKRLLGYGETPGNCLPTNDVETLPGAREAVISAFNSRFDIYESGQLNQINCTPGPNNKCPPSFNSVKDLALQSGGGNLSCGASNAGNGWREIANNYYSYVTSTTPITATPAVMGHPRDICHSTSNEGNCSFPGDPNSPTSRIGSGDWDINAYWRSNHGGSNYPTSLNSAIALASGYATPAGRTYPTRHQVYMWEMGTDASSNMPASKAISSNVNWYAGAVCQPPGTRPVGTTLDRRKLTIAVVNCNAHDSQSGITGSEDNVQVEDWVDVFLVEPSFSRAKTEYGDVYVEIIGSVASGGGSQVQSVRKAVPYLIE